MIYMLDTNVCIELIKGGSASLRHHFARALATKAELLVPTVVAFELWYGVYKSARLAHNTKLLKLFLSGPPRLEPFDEQAALMAGEIRAELEQRGKMIGAYDILIGAQAKSINAVLVTANLKEFKRIKGLKLENWRENKPK